MTRAAPQLPRAPFRGVEPFRFVDHPILFAREAEVTTLLRRVLIYKGVLLYGDSGAGKSSLINAGLLPRVAEFGLAPDRVRVQRLPGREILVERVATGEAGGDSFLSPSLADESPRPPDKGEAGAAFSLEEFERALRSYAQGRRPLLVFDQFEELVTRFEEAPPREELAEARRHQARVIEFLVRLLRDDGLPVKLLFSFREDYLAKLNRLFTLAPELVNRYVRLTPPATEWLPEIVAGPLEKPGLKAHFEAEREKRFGPGAAKGFPKGLEDRLVNELRAQSEGGPQIEPRLVVRVAVPPGQQSKVELKLEPGHHRLREEARDGGQPFEQTFIADDDGEESESFTLGGALVAGTPPRLSRRPRLTLVNETDKERVAFVEKMPSGGRVNLWVAQIVCLMLWEAEDPEALYARKRGVGGLLEDYFEGALARLEARGLKDLSVALLSEMVTATGAANVVSEETLLKRVVSAEGEASEPRVKEALAALVQEMRLVLSEAQPGMTYYRIVSEYLSPLILGEDKERRLRKVQRAVEEKKADYERHIRSQRRLRRALFGTLVAVAVALAAAAAAVIYTTNQVTSQQQAVQEKELQLAAATDRYQYASARLAAAQAELGQLAGESSKANQRLYELARQLDAAQAERDEARRQRDEALGREPVTLVRDEAGRRRKREDRSQTMFGSVILEVAIGLVLVYLLVSLACTAAHELIVSVRGQRAKDLKRGVRLLLDGDYQPSPDANTTSAHFFEHPLIKSLAAGEGSLSYIPSRTFAHALLDMVAPATAGGARTAAEVRAQISNTARIPSELKQTLLILSEGGGDDLSGMTLRIEEWFNNAMDRVSGGYRRRTQMTLLLLGFVAAFLLNLDTVNIANTLSRDSTLRSSLVAQAQVIAEQPQFSPRPVAASPSATPAAATAAVPLPAVKTPEEQIRENINAVQGLGLPLGWVREPRESDAKYASVADPQAAFAADLKTFYADPRRIPTAPPDVALKLLGLLLTALAVSLGAPFWFDLLNKFIVIRSTVKPHEKSPEQPSKDRRATQELDEDLAGPGAGAPPTPPRR